MNKTFDNVDKTTFAPEPLWNKIFNMLREAIIRGDIKPGERLNEAMISSKLGTSRAPVREAIRFLESMNFVKTVPMKGSFVTRITAKEINELFVVLKPIKSISVQLATANIRHSEKLEELKCIVEMMESCREEQDEAILNKLDKIFHNFIINASGNDLLKGINESLLFQRARLQAEKVAKEDVTKIIGEKLAVARAMVAGDAVEAKRFMEEHIDQAKERTLKAFRKRNAEESA